VGHHLPAAATQLRPHAPDPLRTAAFDAKFPELAAGDKSIAGPPEGGGRPLTRESHGGATYPEHQDESRH